MQATGTAKVLDKPLTSHQYSQWVCTFRTSHCWKLHKQIVIDHGGWDQCRQPIKTTLHGAKPARLNLPSHTKSWCLNRHLNRTSTTEPHLCYIGMVKRPCNTLLFSLFQWSDHWTALMHYGSVTSISVPPSEACSLLYQYCLKATENCCKWKLKWVVLLCMGSV